MAETQKEEALVAVAAADITPLAMMERAVSGGADIAVIEKLMELQERWQTNQAARAFTEALSAARGELPAITKTKSADFGKGKAAYRYEDLSEIVEAVSPVLSKHGLSFRWRTDSETVGSVKVTCVLSHREGHEEETTLTGPYDTSGNKNAIQAVGSVVTYLQRYTLKAALGVAAGVDDDGNGGSSQPRSEQQQPDPTTRTTGPTGPSQSQPDGIATSDQRDAWVERIDFLRSTEIGDEKWWEQMERWGKSEALPAGKLGAEIRYWREREDLVDRFNDVVDRAEVLNVETDLTGLRGKLDAPRRVEHDEIAAALKAVEDECNGAEQEQEPPPEGDTLDPTPPPTEADETASSTESPTTPQAPSTPDTKTTQTTNTAAGDGHWFYDHPEWTDRDEGPGASQVGLALVRVVLDKAAETGSSRTYVRGKFLTEWQKIDAESADVGDLGACPVEVLLAVVDWVDNKPKKKQND